MLATLTTLLVLTGPQESSPGEVELLRDLDFAREVARFEGKPLVVIFGAVWCASCRLFERDTLPSPEVREVADDFTWVEVSVDREVTLAASHGVVGTPHFFVFAPGGGFLAETVGALGPVEFRAFLDFAAAREPIALEQREGGTYGEGRSAPLTFTPEGYRSQSICYSQVGYGPLSIPSQAPGGVLRPLFRPRAPSTLARGQVEVAWSETVANIFAFREDDYRLDYLTLNSFLAVSYGVTDTVLVEVAVSDLSRFDSYLDPITDAFHELFGLGDAGRDDFPSRDNVLDLELQDGVEIEDDSSGSESLNLSVSLQHNLTCGTETLPAVAYSLDATYHLGGHADLTGPNKLSLGLSTSVARRLDDDWYAYLGLGYVRHGLDESRGLPLETEQFSSLLAVEWRYAPRASWVLQYLLSEGVASDRDPFDEFTHELNLGWKREIGSGTVLELGLIENIIEPDNSPDFGLHFNLRKRFTR